MLRIGVLASHTGTNFQTIADACAAGELDARVEILISNNSKAGVMERAARAGIRTCHLSSKTHPDPDDLDSAIHAALTSAGVELVVLAGYMKKLGNRVLTQYENRIINVHPALLPKHGGKGFYGMHVHEAVITAGDCESGATVHLVDGSYDTGAILKQEATAVEPGDTPESLAARILKIEHRILIDVIRQFADGALP